MGVIDSGRENITVCLGMSIDGRQCRPINNNKILCYLEFCISIYYQNSTKTWYNPEHFNCLVVTKSWLYTFCTCFLFSFEQNKFLQDIFSRYNLYIFSAFKRAVKIAYFLSEYAVFTIIVLTLIACFITSSSSFLSELSY